MADLLDTLGNIGLGALGGYTSGGGLGGALLGGTASGLINRQKPLTLGSGLTSGLMGAGAGLLARPLSSGIGSLFSGGGAGQTGGMGNRFPGGDSPLGQQSSAGSGGGFLSNLFSGAKDKLSAVPGLLKQGVSGLGGLAGLFGGGGGQQSPGQQQPSSSGGGGGGGGAGGGGSGQSGGPTNFSTGLGMLAGGGGLLAALLDRPEDVDVAGPIAGQIGQAQGRIKDQTGFERALRDSERQQFLSDTQNTRQSLQDLFSPQNLQARLQAQLQPEMASLGAKGLLSGPGGALDEALARQSGLLASTYLPTLANLETGQLSGLSERGGAGVSGDIGLTRGGLDREFLLGDEMRNATINQSLSKAQAEAAKRKALAQLSGGVLGQSIYGDQGGDLGQALGGLF